MGLCLWVLLSVVQLSAQQGEKSLKVLDLTGPAPQTQSTIGMLSGSAGGIAGEKPEPKPRLPLELTVRSVTPASVPVSGQWIIDLLIHNKGSGLFLLPTSRDFGAAYRTEHAGRRTLQIIVRNHTPSDRAPASKLVAFLYGSDSEPTSLLAMKPDEAVVVRFAVSVDTILGNEISTPRDLDLSVACSLKTVEGEINLVKSPFEEVESRNHVTVTVLPKQGVETRPTLPVAPMALRAQVPLIDLVAEPSRRTKSPGSVSGRTGGVTGGPPQPKPIPPLSVRLESVSPSATQPEVRIVEILVTNVSGAPYSLPVGRDGNAAMKPGNRGRREIWFWLGAPRKAGTPLRTLGGRGTYGSDVTDDSLLTLPPGGTVRVRFPVNLRVSTEFHSLKEAGLTSVQVHATVIETWLDDSRIDTDFISRETEASSANTLTLPVQ